MNICAFSAAQDGYVCDSSVLLANALKNHFFIYFSIAQIAFIARTNCNCWVGECAQSAYMSDVGKSLQYLRLFNANNMKQLWYGTYIIHITQF